MRDMLDVVPTPKVERLMDVADGTRTREQVAAILGVCMNTLYSTCFSARRQGFRPRFARKGAGVILELVGGLHPSVQDWFKAQIPQGGTEIDLVRALILDAYLDDAEKGACSNLEHGAS